MMNNENGRSMVEMLGVLAIIGVLSVAGIAGYSMAMSKYKANEMLNEASQAAVLAEAKFAVNSAADASETVGKATATVNHTTKARTITLNGFDVTDNVGKAVKAASNCQIGDFSINSCS